MHLFALTWLYRPALSALATYSLLIGSAQAATLQVSPTGSDSGNCQSGACQTIGYALTQAAASGDTLQVAAGTYSEELTINKSVTVQGAGNTTIIQAPSVLTTNPDVPGGSPGQKTTIIFATGGTTVASMRNLQVQGPGSSGCGSIGYGVFVGGNATLTVDTVHFTAIRDNPLGGCQNGTAVRFGSLSPLQVGSGAVLNSVIDDFQKNGITVTNTGSNVTIRGNTVSSVAGLPIAQNGIQVNGGAVAVVDNNTISNLRCGHLTNCGPDSSWSTGILLSTAGAGTQLTNNRVSNADGNLYAYGSSSTPITVTGNQFSTGTYANVVAEGVTLDMVGNTLTGAPTGLLASGDGGGPTVVNLNGGNTITGASVAGIGTRASDQPITVTGQRNQFFGNTAGASNTNAATMGLACNWWGTATGPANAENPLGTGNPASAEVTYTNWAIDNSQFSCTGNPARNEAQATPPTPVPVNAPWALVGITLALAGLGARTLGLGRKT